MPSPWPAADPLVTTAFEQAIVDWVDEHRLDALALLKRLVRTPSYSGREGVAADASTVAGQVFAAAADHGGRVEAQAVDTGSENVIELIPGSGPRTFVLEAHMDTVPEGDRRLWHGADPFSAAEGFVEYLGQGAIAIDVGGARYRARIRDRMARIWERRERRRLPLVYGRGSFDNKGPLVSTVMAMGALAAAARRTGSALAGSAIGAYTVDEEVSARGVRAFACAPDSWLARHGYLDGPTDAGGFLRDISGIAMDGSYGWTPVVGHRGSAQFELRTTGRSAHASTPELGANAVELMARLLLHLERSQDGLRARLLGPLEPALVGPPTFAVGTTIVGGGVQTVTMTERGPAVERSGVNAIPNWCRATVDVRFPPARDLGLEGSLALIKEVLEDSLRTVGLEEGCSWELVEIERNPPVALAPDLEGAARLPLVQTARRRATQVLGFEPPLETAPGGTDATLMINQAGIRTLVEFGPAGGLSHDTHEFVEVDSVVDGAKILALTVLDNLGLEGREADGE